MRFPLDTFHNSIVQAQDPEAKCSPSSENATLYISEKPLRVLMRSPLDTLHNPIVLSPDPEAKYSPSFENATLVT